MISTRNLYRAPTLADREVGPAWYMEHPLLIMEIIRVNSDIPSLSESALAGLIEKVGA